jgi:hypothetical protein
MGSRASIEQRGARAGEEALRAQGYVAPVDVLVGMGWLQPVHRDQWRQGRVAYLEQVVQAGLGKVSTAMRALRRVFDHACCIAVNQFELG